jgi:hypothetical protein
MNLQWLLSILKIGTVISYCLIPISGEHFGLPLGLGLFIGSLAGKFPASLTYIFSILTLIFIIYSMIKPKQRRDIYIFPFGALILLIPLAEQFMYLNQYDGFVGNSSFFQMSILFLVLMTSAIILIFNLGNDKISKAT